MVTILGHEVLLFEKPRLCKQGILITIVYFLMFIIKECLCIELSCSQKFPWMDLPFNSCTTTNFSFVRNQCLVLRHNFSEKICKLPIQSEQRTRELRKSIFLNFCNQYNLAEVMSESDILTHIEGRNCVEFLRKIECRDSLAEAMYNQFADLLTRMDCQKPYSVSWNCTNCLHSYKKWTCSRQFSLFHGDIEIPPCNDICENVQNRCPFFRPSINTVHAGEPSFLCKSLKEAANDSLSNDQCYPACYLDFACSLPEIKPEVVTSNSSIPSNCCSHHICNFWTNVIGLFCLWLVRTFIQYMSIGLT
ncbi:NALCN channel auxiliary factor 2-like [Mytilus californianus]|nr:NALCN channel auxiliary factor 2-like [Mytilus californianus]